MTVVVVKALLGITTARRRMASDASATTSRDNMIIKVVGTQKENKAVYGTWRVRVE